MGEVEQLMASMAQSGESFDREDVNSTARMRRVLASELDWRKRRLAIAVREYDEKIVRLIHIMNKRNEVLRAHGSLESDALLTPLKSFFANKQKELEGYSDQLKQRMRKLLVRPLEQPLVQDEGGPEEDRPWRQEVKKELTSSETAKAAQLSRLDEPYDDRHSSASVNARQMRDAQHAFGRTSVLESIRREEVKMARSRAHVNARSHRASRSESGESTDDSSSDSSSESDADSDADKGRRRRARRYSSDDE
jgi:hypothetical protein